MKNKRMMFRTAAGVLFVLAVAGVRWNEAAPAPEGSAWRVASGAMTAAPDGGQVQVRTLASADNEQRLVFRFPAPQLNRGADGVFDVSLPSADHAGQPGAPVLPLVATRVAVPQGHEVVSLAVVPGDGRDYVLDGPVRHAQEPYPLSRPQDRRLTPADAGIYGQDAPYPATVFSAYAVHTKRGVALAHFVLYPVVYRPASGRLTAYETLTVHMVTRAADTRITPAADAGRWRARFRSTTDAQGVAALLDNPETLDSYEPEPPAPDAVRLADEDEEDGEDEEEGEEGEEDYPALPCRLSDTFHYVIITSTALRDSIRGDNFNTVAMLREAQGLATVIVTTEAIQNAYPGVDAAAAVRTFIRDAYDKWDTEYVLLGGDSSVVPMRVLYANVGLYREHIPSDLYFQCLDGSFDSNGNGIWGQPMDGADRMDGRPGEDIDLYAELAVGRIPVSNVDDLENWARKQRVYETDRITADATYLRGALMIGEHLGFGGISEYGGPMMEEIRLGATTHGYRTDGFTKHDIHTNIVTLYEDTATTWSNEDLAGIINQDRVSMLNHLGHSDFNYNMKFRIEDVGLLNNERPGFLYSQGCWAGAFDRDSIAEAFLAGSPHAFFGGVFNSRYGWGTLNSTDGPSQRYNRWFWHAFFGDWIPVAGLMNQQAHERNAARINEPAMRWVYYTSNLLGDPAQWLYGIDLTVRLDREAYRPDAEADVEVIWPLGGVTRRTVEVRLQVYDADGIETGMTNLVCGRIGSVGLTGRYLSGPVALSALGATSGGRVTAYAELMLGTHLTVRGDEARIDAEPPVISNLRATAVEETWIDVSWDTDEHATGTARAGTQLPLTDAWTAGPTVAGTNLTVRLEGLTPFTRYYIGVQAKDVAGNRVSLPDVHSTSPDDYLTVSTVGREPVARYDWVRGPEGWTTTNLNGGICWEYGEPVGYGPQAAGRCWGTVLDGRYPDGANARLTSPPFTVRGAPRIRFRHWHDIQYSMEMGEGRYSPPPYGDYGQVEVLSQGVWQNVTAYADVSGGRPYLYGRSEGWQTVSLALPPEFAHQTLAVRFRFVTDQQSFLDGNPAGWYVQDLMIMDVPDSGLGISRIEVRDDDGTGLGLVLDGDGDGLAEPGETVALRPWLFNYGTSTASGLSGSFVVLTGGNPPVDVELTEGAPAAVSYAPVVPGTAVAAQPWTRLRLAPDLPAGTVISLLQTLTNAAGDRIESRRDLVVGIYVTIAGRVEDIDGGAAVAGATVTAVRGDAVLQTVSGADGGFVLEGAVSAAEYTVTAAKPGVYSPLSLRVKAPADGVVFALGRSAATVTPTALVFTAFVGGEDTQPLMFSNAPDATADMQISLERVDYRTGDADWLFMALEAFTLAPGASRTVNVTADAATLAPGYYPATLVLATDDPARQPHIEIPVAFNVRQQPVLVFGGVLIDDDDGGDGDGRLEAGESGEMWIYLNNLSGLSEAFELQGELEPLHPGVALTGAGTMDWTYIPAYGSRLSDLGVGLALDPGIAHGEDLEFRLTVNYDGGSFMTNFVYRHRLFYAVTGGVDTVVWSEAAGDPDIEPVAGAVVMAEDAAGLQYSSFPTDAEGAYYLSVPAGDLWFTVIPPSGYPYAAPAGTNVFVDADPTEANFRLGDYGENAPLLKLYDVIVDDSVHGDGDGAIDPGERLVLRARLYNRGPISALGVTGLLEAADMGAVPPCMDVTGAETLTPLTLLPAPWWWTPAMTGMNYLRILEPFEVVVDPDAAPGDRQRFWLTASDGQTPARVWPFDFSLIVNPLYAVSGTVRYDNEDGMPAAGVRVNIAYGNGEGGNTLTGLDGRYDFGRIPFDAAVTVQVVVPDGFASVPARLTVDPLDADTDGLDFILMQSSVTLAPFTLSATLPEGTTTNAVLTVGNTGDQSVTVDLRVSYRRGQYDVSPPETDPLAVILAASAVEDWTLLSAEDYVEGELEIRFADGIGWMERHAILEQHGLRALFHLKLVPACVAVPVDGTPLGGDPAALAPLANALNADPRILYVQPAAKVMPQAQPVLPNDPLFEQLYGLRNERQTGGTLGADINVAPVWEKTTGSRDVIVAICDTGMDLLHEDLAPNLWRNPLEQPGDANRDRYPGVRGVDDDGDAERQKYHVNPVTGEIQGPERVHALFAPDMWADNQAYKKVPGSLNAYHWEDGPNNIPDFFEPFLAGHESFAALRARAQTLEDVHYNVIGDILVDSNGDGVPDIFIDSDGDGIPDLFADEDGDGIINETGIDFRDEDVMLADYNNNGHPLIRQKLVWMPWLGGRQFRVLVEQWDLAVHPFYFPVSGYDLAVQDDDENGYANDFHGWNFFDGDNNVSDGDLGAGHGSHVAGTIGAAGDNGTGIAGVNWTVSLMPLRLTSEGKFTRFTSFGRIAMAMEYALRKGVQVSNHSWGGSVTAGVFYEVMKRAERDYNHLFVIAAGNAANDLDKTRIYPAYFSTVLNNVITVAATDHDGQLAPFSSWGRDSVQIAAPGTAILSTLPAERVPRLDGDALPLAGAYGLLSGTSMAAPHVAGAAALLWAHAPDAHYEAVKNALLEGARPDPNLQGWVTTGGHLDVGRALTALGRDWLTLSTHQVEVAPDSNQDLEVFFNADLNTAAGYYEAEIIAGTGTGRRRVPVSLEVLAQPRARIMDIRRVSDTDGDGYAEPGETVEFHISLRNTGSGTFVNLQGSLTALTPAEATVTTGTAVWDALYSGDTGESLTAYRVQLSPAAPAEVAFALALTAEEAQPQTLTLTLPVVPRHTLAGRVMTAGGAGVPGALVEYRGAAGGRTTTDAGGHYALQGLVAGVYTLRAIPPAQARSTDRMLPAVAGGGVTEVPDLVVGSPAVTFSVEHMETTQATGMSGTAVLTVTNTSDEAYVFAVEIMPRRRIGLFDDGTGLGVLVPPLRRMGFEVDHFTDNFDIVHYINPDTAQERVLQDVRYTKDDENVFAYDLVIADLTGPRGQGRVFRDDEAEVFARYLDRGGRVIFTGGNPLNRPDNERLAALCGVGLGRAGAAEHEAVAAAFWNGVFVQLTAGHRIAVANGIHDLALPETGTEVLFTAGAAAKLTHRPAAGAAGTGEVYLWGGNPFGADWREEGVWLDVLRDLLRETFMEPAAGPSRLDWLQVTPAAGVAANSTVDLTITFDTTRLASGTYRAVVALIGLDQGEEVYAVPVTLTVNTRMLHVFNSGPVTDWRGLPLQGDGGPAAALYQVIYAGADGSPNPPATNALGAVTGAPTGDDRLLTVFPSGEAFGRFGGWGQVAADSGKFDALFANTLAVDTGQAAVYVRAWDAASFAAALGYGDSTVLHPLAFSPGETADFGTWQVTNIINFTRDSNTNSLPDGWIMKYRPDLDPRAPFAPLMPGYTSLGSTTLSRHHPGNPAPRPYRVVQPSTSGAFMFVLDTPNNRIVIIPSNASSAHVTFGAPGTGNGQFGQPEGMAVDPRPGHYRLAVADTGNHRVQLFAYNPSDGALTFERTFGAYGSGTNRLNRPAAVAFDNTGRIFVADKLNHRIVSFRASDGSWLGAFSGGGAYVLNAPQGVCVDPDVADGGVWVADTANNRVTLYTTAGVFRRSIGGQGSVAGRFHAPVDVQLWRVGPRRRLTVADKVNNRVQIFGMDGTHLLSVGTGGSLPGELRLPHGVQPLTDRPELWVADTDNGRVQHFTLILDADQDGMDDVWEDLHGLDSTTFDAYGDPDGDGLFNIAEFLIGSDPRKDDTNGDGVTDGDAVQAGEDPTADGSAPAVFSLSATPAIVPAGGMVTLTLVYERPLETEIPVMLDLNGGASESLTLTRVNANTYVAAYLTAPRASGVVNAEVRGGGWQLADVATPVQYLRSGLFTIYFPPFRITSAGAGVPARLTWESVAGAGYQIETNASLLDSGWGVLTNVITSEGPESTVELGPQPPALFFRVKRVGE